MNSQVVICGSSGSGKSTSGQYLLNQATEQGTTVIAFDIHNVLDNQQISPQLRKKFYQNINSIDVYNDGISYPLFTPIVFSDGEVENITSMLDALTQTLAKPCKFGTRQKEALKSGIYKVYHSKAYEKDGFVALGDALDDIGTAKALEVKERLSPLIDGNIFHHGFDFIKPGKINIFRLSKFPLDTQHMISEIIINLIWKQAVQGAFSATGVILFIDECHNLDTGKNGIISQILREGRRFNVHLILATQVLSTEAYMSKLMMQASLVLFFKPPKNEMAMVAKLIQPGNEERWIGILANLSRGECIACGVLTLESGATYTRPLKITVKLENEESNLSIVNK